MKMNVNRMRAASCFSALSLFAATAAVAQTGAQGGTLSEPLARAFTQRVIELVEQKGLPPRNPGVYAQAKADLLAMVEKPAAEIDRRKLHQAATALLRTLDVDGHSYILEPNAGPAPAAAAAATATATAAAAAPSFRMMATQAGKVLLWTPPQFKQHAPGSRNEYMRRFYADSASLGQPEAACALVVDLTAQRGGSIAGPMQAMRPLFSSQNQAVMVDKYDLRRPLVSSSLAKMEEPDAGGAPHPLMRFAATPFAVVVNGETASAGEMIFVALMGEVGRAQSFGHPTGGMATGNATYRLPDASLLVLSEVRFALGKQAPFKGRIPVANVPADAETDVETLERAALWAARHSQLCNRSAGT